MRDNKFPCDTIEGAAEAGVNALQLSLDFARETRCGVEPCSDRGRRAPPASDGDGQTAAGGVTRVGNAGINEPPEPVDRMGQITDEIVRRAAGPFAAVDREDWHRVSFFIVRAQDS